MSASPTRISGPARGSSRVKPPIREDVELAARIVEAPWSEMHAVEEFVLSVSDDGLGKRTSAYEYRITGRGGIGIVNMDLDRDNGEARVVGTFPVRADDELILVTNGGQIIRVPVDGIGVVGPQDPRRIPVPAG